MIGRRLELLALTRYARLGASSRMRFLQYVPHLERNGVFCDLAPLLDDDYIRNLQSARKSPGPIAMAYWRRLRALRRARNFDLLWIEYEALPWIPFCIERLLLAGDVPYVVDFDDAVFHRYDQHRLALVRCLLGRKHDALMRGARLVLAGNAYLAERARSAGASWIEIVPTVVDMARYPIFEASRPATPPLDRHIVPVVGWIGQRSTAKYLQPLAPLMARLTQEGLADCVAVGVDADGLGLPMRFTPWSEDTETRDIAGFDIGIMPLPDEPFERGKCGYKLIQYMACGLPVVASPVGVNRQIVDHGVNGFLAGTDEEWEWALRTLLADASLRHRMGRAGRAKVEAQFCLQVMAPHLSELLMQAACASVAVRK